MATTPPTDPFDEPPSEALLSLFKARYPGQYAEIVADCWRSGASTPASCSTPPPDVEMDDSLHLSGASPAPSRPEFSQVPDEEGFTEVRNKRKAPTSPTPGTQPASKASRPVASTSRAHAQQPRPSTSQPRSSTPPAAPKAKVPPPIIIQDKGSWNQLSAELSQRKLNFLSARNTASGIQVSVASSDDHRALTRYLLGRKISYHSYALPEERLLRVVIRGIPKEIATDLIKEDLASQGLPIEEVHRMYRARTKEPFDLILAVLPLTPEGKKVFEIAKVCEISGISIEKPHRRGSIGQCHNCQLYGHSARNCHARPRCVKCLGDHGTPQCTRSRDTAAGPPSCVLCATEGHPANYRGCPKAPRSAKRGRPSRRGGRPEPQRALPNAQRAPQASEFPPLPAASQQAPPAASQQRPPAASQPPPPVIRRDPRPGAAWARPPAMVTQPRLAPSSQPQPLPPRPAPAGPQRPAAPQQGLAADLKLLLDSIRGINMREVSILANKIRTAARDPAALVFAFLEHADLISALQTTLCP